MSMIDGMFEVKRDLEFGGEPSRGWYIVKKHTDGLLYLHHDGKVKKGVTAYGDKPAFWPTKEDADYFLNGVK